MLERWGRRLHRPCDETYDLAHGSRTTHPERAWFYPSGCRASDAFLNWVLMEGASVPNRRRHEKRWEFSCRGR